MIRRRRKLTSRQREAKEKMYLRAYYTEISIIYMELIYEVQ
jgi:hypothetical protein